MSAEAAVAGVVFWPGTLAWPAAALGLLGAVIAGLVTALLVAAWPHPSSWEDRVKAARRRRDNPLANQGPRGSWRTRAGAVWPRHLRSLVQAELERAGSRAPAEEYLGGQIVVEAVTALFLIVAASQGWLSVLGALALAAAPPAVSVLRLARAAAGYRTEIVSELPILVDLMALEQTGGGIGSRRAMELVVARTKGPATSLLRDCLSRSATPGSPALDDELELAAQRHRVPALTALAAVVRMQRQEGIAAGSPLANLARGLRDRQRDQLTERGRRALVSMLLPVAACILLPFILIVLYPAISQFGQVFS